MALVPPSGARRRMVDLPDLHRRVRIRGRVRVLHASGAVASARRPTAGPAGRRSPRASSPTTSPRTSATGSAARTAVAGAARPPAIRDPTDPAVADALRKWRSAPASPPSAGAAGRSRGPRPWPRRRDGRRRLRRPQVRAEPQRGPAARPSSRGHRPLRLAVRQLPLADVHALALTAAEALEAADAQGRFFELLDRLAEAGLARRGGAADDRERVRGRPRAPSSGGRRRDATAPESSSRSTRRPRAAPAGCRRSTSTASTTTGRSRVDPLTKALTARALAVRPRRMAIRHGLIFNVRGANVRLDTSPLGLGRRLRHPRVTRGRIPSIGHVVPAAPRGLAAPAVPGRRRVRAYIGWFCFVVVAYYAAAHLGYALKFAGPVASIVWLPVGVGIAALYLLGPQFWPAVVIGDLLVNNYSTLPAGLRDRAELRQPARGPDRRAAAAAVRLPQHAARLDLRVRGPAGGAAGRHARERDDRVAVDGARQRRLGRIDGASVADLVARRPVRRADRRPARDRVAAATAARAWFEGRVLELALVLAALVGLTLLGWQMSRPMSFLALPALTWAALRFGPRGGSLAILIGAALTIWATTHYMGPFAFRSVSQSVLDTQVYLAVSAAATLCVAALARERERLVEGRPGLACADRRRGGRRAQADRAQHPRRRPAAPGRAVRASDALGRARRAREPEAAEDGFESAQAELQRAIDELRDLVHGIRPPALRRFGLVGAIELAAARSSHPRRARRAPAGAARRDGRDDRVLRRDGGDRQRPAVRRARRRSG